MLSHYGSTRLPDLPDSVLARVAACLSACEVVRLGCTCKRLRATVEHLSGVPAVSSDIGLVQGSDIDAAEMVCQRALQTMGPAIDFGVLFTVASKFAGGAAEQAARMLPPGCCLIGCQVESIFGNSTREMESDPRGWDRGGAVAGASLLLGRLPGRACVPFWAVEPCATRKEKPGGRSGELAWLHP